MEKLYIERLKHYLKSGGDPVHGYIEDLDGLVAKNAELEKRLSDISKAIQEIRDIDTGAWLKDCESTTFSCSDGRECRLALMKALDALYKITIP